MAASCIRQRVRYCIGVWPSGGPQPRWNREEDIEFNVFEYFKDYKRSTEGPVTPEAQGTSFFLGGPMGKRIREGSLSPSMRAFAEGIVRS